MSKHFPSVACCVSHLADGNFPLHRKPTNVAGQWPRSLYVVGDSRIAFVEESHGTSEDVVAQEVCVSLKRKESGHTRAVLSCNSSTKFKKSRQLVELHTRNFENYIIH